MKSVFQSDLGITVLSSYGNFLHLQQTFLLFAYNVPGTIPSTKIGNLCSQAACGLIEMKRYVNIIMSYHVIIVTEICIDIKRVIKKNTLSIQGEVT